MKPEQKQVKKRSSKFCILQQFEKVRITKRYRERNQYLIYDNHKVIISRLLCYTSPLLLKLLKQKLSLLCSRINAKKQVFVVPYHISWQRIAIRCVVTVNYGHFSHRHNSRIVLSNGSNQIPILQLYCM